MKVANNLVSIKLQGNLKEESDVAAILLSHMEASYCTAGVFIGKPTKQILLNASCLSCVDRYHTGILVLVW